MQTLTDLLTRARNELVAIGAGATILVNILGEIFGTADFTTWDGVTAVAVAFGAWAIRARVWAESTVQRVSGLTRQALNERV